jgi:hypothetical protein
VPLPVKFVPRPALGPTPGDIAGDDLGVLWAARDFQAARLHPNQRLSSIPREPFIF